MKHSLIIMDGGMGHELAKSVGLSNCPVGENKRFLKICMANKENPRLVIDAHKNFINNGCNVITMNNYAAIPDTMKFVGEDYKEIIRASGECSKKAVKETGKQILIAGSIPPLTASYRPDLVYSDSKLNEIYKIIVNEISFYCDILLCETMSCLREAQVAASLASTIGKPVWVFWTLSEDADCTLRSGENVKDAWDAISDLPNLELVGFNCSSVDAITNGIKCLYNYEKFNKKIKFGAQANAFVSVKNGEYDIKLSPEAYMEYAKVWVNNGASVIGGCCGIFPEHIKKLSNLQI